jgi:DNA-binding NarL/FixJ family response regulator
MRYIRIPIVDDHNPLRDGLSWILENTPGLRVVGRCAGVAEAFSVVSETGVDVVLLDFDLGQEQGFKLLAELRLSKPEIKVPMDSGGITDEANLRVLGAGASGVFLKHSNPN